MPNQHFPNPEVKAVTKDLGAEEGDVFRFTIWDLLVLTTVVALFYGLPPGTQAGLAVSAMFVLVLCGPLVMVSFPTRVRPTAMLKRLLLPSLLRSAGFAALILLLAGAAAAFQPARG